MRKTISALLILTVCTVSGYAQEKRNLYLNGSLFEDVTAESGLNHIGHGKCTSMADFDGDGDLDIFLGICFSPNKFFQNQGDFRFVDVSLPTGIDNVFDTHGAAFADFDNNGYIDLFVANNVEAYSDRRGILKQPNSLYMLAAAVFVDAAADAGVAGMAHNYSCGVTTADIDNDGLLDIYVAEGGYLSGTACANSLYLNNGDGTFSDVGRIAGVADKGNGYCCAFADYDNDGDPDLYVGNLNDQEFKTTRHLYRNDGNLKFTDVTEKLGLAAAGYNVSCYWGDIDNDGDLDLFLGNSSGRGAARDSENGRNSLFRNNGDGTFTDISRDSGVDIATNTRGCTMGDADNDGDLDIYVLNSNHDALFFINDGSGKFKEMAQDTGACVFYGHGTAMGDLDDDGDLDIVVGNWRNPRVANPGAWKLFKNKTNNGKYLKVRVQGTESNRSAVMTKISVYDSGYAGDRKHLRGYREVTAGNGTFPGNPLIQHFGVDDSGTYDVVVNFPSGNTAMLKGITAGQTLDVVESK